jgi:hypothetical protein
MHLSWLGLVLMAAFGSAADTPSESVGPGAASWNLIAGPLIFVGAVLSVVATLIVLVGLRPARQGKGATG